ncbi:hypothetical protein [Peribacillus loiseleuriae]|uniref:hypothetical protein n=1 Tax=Peribacillus loiseleuriae TaxID=1679170 RepID=UPI003CFBD430
MEDRHDTLTCPKCSKKTAPIYGEGHVNYVSYEKEPKNVEPTNKMDKTEKSQIPELLTVEHVTDYFCGVFSSKKDY